MNDLDTRNYSYKGNAASAFSEYFYKSLGQKEPVAIALRQGQSAMGIEGNQWYRPVLYLRWQDNEGGQLFKDSSIQSGDISHSMPTENSRGSQQTVKSQRQKLRLQEELDDLIEERDVCNSQYRSAIYAGLY